MGLTRNLRPKFVRRYADLSTVIADAAKAFTKDVKTGQFPSREETFTGHQTTTLRRVH
jgi:3-methyl-2-oxobutanoate hydroxymethyltransferase